MVGSISARAPEPVLHLGRRARRLAAPLLELSVPMACYQGRTPGGLAARVLVAGNSAGGASRYFLKRIFADFDACNADHQRRVSLLALPQALRRMRDEADLTLADVDRFVARRMFAGEQYLRVPEWLLSTLPVPTDVAALMRGNNSIRSDVRVIERSGLSPRISRDPHDFERFHQEMYLPFTGQRHGSSAVLRERGALKRHFNRGGLMWIMQDGREIAGALYDTKGSSFRLLNFGTPGGDYEPVKRGAMAAAYWFGIEMAKAGGFTLIWLGGTRPCAKDGVFVYKRKWGVHSTPKPDARQDLLVRWREPGPFAREYLTHSPLLFRDQDGLALVAAVEPGVSPERTRDLLWSEGVGRSFIIGATANSHPVSREILLRDPLHAPPTVGETTPRAVREKSVAPG
ncbi:MAG TPA: hypothetical protein VH518_09865 [Tepidisphaeraceae bacterium]|jgi:hypothetical protein